MGARKSTEITVAPGPDDDGLRATLEADAGIATADALGEAALAGAATVRVAIAGAAVGCGVDVGRAVVLVGRGVAVGVATAVKVIVPCIAGWISQWYANVPALDRKST